MRPCCYGILGETVCRNTTGPDDEWLCTEIERGVLGPDGTCCAHPHTPVHCPAGHDPCWRCAENVPEGSYHSCCFPDLDYQWFGIGGDGPLLKPTQCDACGGVLDASQESCLLPEFIRPCCCNSPTYCPDTFCWNVTNSAEASVCSQVGGVLGPLGTCCANTPGDWRPCPAGFPHCWHCPEDFPAANQYGSCCVAEYGYEWYDRMLVEQCFASCGGTPGVSEEDCQREPPVQECLEAQDDREWYVSAPRWTINTTDTVIFGLTKVTMEWTDTEVGGGRDWEAVLGYTYGLTTHLTRPQELDIPRNACAQAVSRVTMLDDGYCYAETCSVPDINNLDSHRRSYGLLRTIEQTDPQIGVEAGYQYDVTCIRLPAWTEALYRSHKLHCGDAPV